MLRHALKMMMMTVVVMVVHRRRERTVVMRRGLVSLPSLPRDSHPRSGMLYAYSNGFVIARQLFLYDGMESTPDQCSIALSFIWATDALLFLHMLPPQESSSCCSRSD